MLASSRKPTHQCTRAFGDGFHNGAVATCSQITDGTKINNPVHNTAKNMLAKKKHLWMKMSESGGQKQTRMLANSCNLQTTALGERERSSRNVTVSGTRGRASTGQRTRYGSSTSLSPNLEASQEHRLGRLRTPPHRRDKATIEGSMSSQIEGSMSSQA